MKILIIHNNYGIHTGEESVVDHHVSLFQEMGHEVIQYRKTTEGVRGTWTGNIKGLLSGFYSPRSVREIKELLRKETPDIAVVHNLYPFISPAVLKHIKKARIPIVMTVHNFRLMCPTGLFMQDYRPCERCLGGKEWNCVRYNCEGQLMKSVGYAGRNWYARVTKSYINNVDKYACITKFQIQKLTEAGFDKNKMVHIPNFLSEEAREAHEAMPDGDYVAISGRLSKEKGIDLALRVARETPEIRYKFAGTLREEETRREFPPNCILTGHLSKDELSAFYRDARFLMNMSRCYEGFPMTILEAASYGKPTIGPGHAGFLEIIDDEETGLHFEPGNTADLKAKVTRLWNAPDRCRTMGKEARRKYRKQYTAAVVKDAWATLLATIVKAN